MKTKAFLLLMMWVSIFESGLAQQIRPQHPGLEPANVKTDKNWEFVKDRLFESASLNN